MNDLARIALELKASKLRDEDLAKALQVSAQTCAQRQADMEAANSAYIEATSWNRVLLETVDTRRLADNTSALDWEYLLDATGPETTAKYNALKGALAGLVKDEKYGRLSLQQSGTFSETQQTAVQVALIRGRPDLTAGVLAALESTLLPHIRPIPGSTRLGRSADPQKQICLFEHSLCLNGSFFLAINEELKQFEIRVNRYSQEHLVYKAETLMELLAKVEDEFFYADANDSDD